MRAAATIALGTFIGNGTDRTDHAMTINHNIGVTLLSVANDGSAIVRQVSTLVTFGSAIVRQMSVLK